MLEDGDMVVIGGDGNDIGQMTNPERYFSSNPGLESPIQPVVQQSG